MRALLQRGAAGAAQRGGGQQIHSSLREHPTSLRGLSLRGGPGAGIGNGVGNGFGHPADVGAYSSGGGGYDYPSIPDPTDPTQSPASTAPGPVADALPAPASPGPVSPGPSLPAPYAPAGTLAPTIASPTGGTETLTSPSSDFYRTDPSSGGAIHLGNGLYYDPSTDSVVGSSDLGGNARRPGAQL
jgi:hypothetical protein